ncbi:MAG TPA: CoA-binding protein [Terriglobia bacterium]|nr:CoA-binding protein [Terriglobia bacterium]
MRHASVTISSGHIRERRWSHSAHSIPDEISTILERYHTLVVVGLSSKPSRPSNGVAAYMKARGYHIIPVNPNEKVVLGEKAYAALEDVPGPIEMVVVFRNPEHVPAVVESAIHKGAKVVWMQEGVMHEAAARHARESGVQVIQDRCILKEYAKRFLANGI